MKLFSHVPHVWIRILNNMNPDLCELKLFLILQDLLSSRLTILSVSIKFSLTFFVYAFQTPPPANSSWVI